MNLRKELEVFYTILCTGDLEYVGADFDKSFHFV